MLEVVPSSPEGDDKPPPIAHARRTDPQTSHAAARSLKSEAIRRLRLIVYDTLKERGPMHDTDLVAILEPTGYSPSGIRTRRCELVTAGRVMDTGKRVVLPSHREAILWGVVEDGEPPGSAADSH